MQWIINLNITNYSSEFSENNGKAEKVPEIMQSCSNELCVSAIVALITPRGGISYKFHDRSHKTYQQIVSDRETRKKTLIHTRTHCLTDWLTHSLIHSHQKLQFICVFHRVQKNIALANFQSGIKPAKLC